MSNGCEEPIKALFQQALSAANASKWETAENICKKLLAIQPGRPDACYLLGLVYQNSGQYDLAITTYEEILTLPGCNADAFNNLGTIHESMGNTTKAMGYYKKSVQCDPSHFQANYNLGRTSRMVGDLHTATLSLKAALVSDHNSVPTLLELSLAFKNSGDIPQAISYASKARVIQPDNPVIHNLLGNIFQQSGDLANARHSYCSAIALREDYAEAYNNLGNTCLAKGEVSAALSYYRKAIKLRPGQTGAESNALMAENYISDSQEYLYTLHERWASRLGLPATQKKELIRDRNRGKIRIGYVSPDFRAHSVSWFLMAILQHYDQERFHVTCFSDTGRPDRVTGMIRSLADDWRNISGLSTNEVITQITECNIDILVDLAGHTANNRLEVFAIQAAPVQVSYLGYPNTTGLQTVDYRITDSVADPPGEADCLHTETLIRLPNCFVCYSPFEESPESSTAPVTENNYITFGSFNVLAKISDECIRTWCAILNTVKESRLILKSAGLDDPETRHLIGERFSQCNTDPGRVIMISRTDSFTTHLQLYSRMDIALDTFPYNGTTTTCESLWMGVPVITLGGNRHAGRVGQSLLTHAGLEELVTGSVDEYIAKAAQLAGNRELLYTYRNTLRKRMFNSPLCDGPGFTRSLEKAFSDMLRP